MRRALVMLSKRVLPNSWRRTLIIRYQKALHWAKYGDANFPHAVCLEISTWCNRTCCYCPNSSNPTPTIFMSDKVFDMCLLRMSQLDWSGPVDYNRYNEPTADKRLPELVKRTVSWVPKALPRIITNGDYLTPEYVELLIESGVVNFSITRHPPYSQAWDRKLKALMEQFPQYITYNGVINTPPLLSNRGGAVEIPNYIPISTCHAPSLGFQITYTGDVTLCCADYHKQHVYGNVMEQDLITIWRNPAFKAVREAVRDGFPILPICKNCFGVSNTCQVSTK